MIQQSAFTKNSPTFAGLLFSYLSSTYFAICRQAACTSGSGSGQYVPFLTLAHFLRASSFPTISAYTKEDEINTPSLSCSSSQTQNEGTISILKNVLFASMKMLASSQYGGFAIST